EAAKALRREAVLEAIVEAEKIEPGDEQLLEELGPAAERAGQTPEELLERVRKNGQLDRLRRDVAEQQAVELLVSHAKAISVEQAKARDKLWTPGKDEAEGAGQL